MYSLILKITHNTKAKDAIAVARGIYRVFEAGVYSNGNTNIRRSSWMDDMPQIKSQSSQTIKIKKLSNQQGDTIVKQNQTNILKLNQESNNDNLITKQIQNPQIKEPIYKNHLQKVEKKDYYDNNIRQQQISSIPSSRLSRIFEFAKLGLSLATTSALSKGKNEAFYQDVAEKVTNQLCKMRGAPLKLAQMLSIQQDNLIPPAIRNAFEKARESAHVIPEQEVLFMLERNFGKQWQKKFNKFELKPFASASIGQVHRATLLSGEQVAVKVQYNQVRESIESDIKNLGMLLKLPGVFPKGMFVQRILSKTRQELMQQCDYLKEKFYQQKYTEYLEKSLGQQSKLYKVPKIYSDLTTAQILTSEFTGGIKMKNLESEDFSQQIRDEIGRRIMKLTFKQLFSMGIMQSDPNPSNFTYNHIQDQLNLYDFGATHIYKKAFLESYYQIIQGAVLKNQNQIWEASIKTGFVTGQENQAMKSSHIESIMITGQPLRFDGKYDFGLQEITSRIYKTIPLMLKNRLKPPPEEVYSLHRKLSGSYLACIRLKSRVNCQQIFKQIKFQALACEEKYIQDKKNF